jgi:hypothetical protein
MRKDPRLDQSRRRERERRQRRDTARSPAEAVHSPAATAPDGHTRRAAASVCGWCGGPVTPGLRGPIPTWCSATCRHRAWEQRRAAASGHSAVQVIERHVPVPGTLQPTRRDWPRLLGELADQINDGRVYDHDLPGLAGVLEPVLQSYWRRARRTGAADPG